MNCVSCDSPRRVNWSPLFRQFLCSHCLDKLTEAELRSTRTEEWVKFVMSTTFRVA